MKKLLCFLLTFSIFSSFLFSQQVDYVPDNFVSLADECVRMNAKLFYDPLTSGFTLQKNGNIVSFSLNDGIIVLNYKFFKVTETPVIFNNQVFVSKSLIEEAQILFAQKNSDKNFKISTILIDPGHGGKDPGTIGSVVRNGKKQNLYEKDIVLQVGKELNNMLKAEFPDKNIIMTRSTDVFLSLEQRVEIANNVKLNDNEAIIYISIHANSAFKPEASGYEVWYLSPGYRRSVLTEKDADAELLPILNSMMEEEFTTESILMAKFIHDGIQKEVGDKSKSRGLKAEEWFVCRNANMPSVLIEVGFVSNPQEAELLSSSDYLNKVTSGIYNGVGSFVAHFEKSRGFTSIQ